MRQPGIIATLLFAAVLAAGGASPADATDRYLILPRHARILSFETTGASKPATFARLEQLAKAAMKRIQAARRPTSDSLRPPASSEEDVMADTYAKASISTEAAHRLIAAAEAKADELGKPFVTAIVDDGGALKALSRMDGAPLISIQVAQDKAYTAAGFGLPTHGWHDFIKDDPPLASGAPSGIERLVVFGGGYPLMVGDQLVGAIGVSGGHYSEDMAVAEAALAVVG
jgi:uncharacterized protein GlcG (DUF336 family)